MGVFKLIVKKLQILIYSKLTKMMNSFLKNRHVICIIQIYFKGPKQ